MSTNEQMSFLQHLEQLRWHLVRAVVAMVVLAVLAFLNTDILFDKIIFGVKQPDFITFQWLCQLSEWLYATYPSLVASSDVLCIGQNIPDLQNINMSGQFTTHIMASLIAGLVLSFPYVFWEIWLFIKPGLEQNEVKKTRGIVFWVSILFFMGVSFGYFLIAPLSVNFFATYSISDSVTTLPTLSTYITTVTTVVLASGFVFELPVLMSILARIGIISAAFLKKYRKHFVVVALILSAIITPPDIFSQLLVTGPLMLLYEVSIVITARIEKRREV